MAARGQIQNLYFFFFQAEDGIRDVAVTGVQTCALPISIALQILLKKREQYISAVVIRGVGGKVNTANVVPLIIKPASMHPWPHRQRIENQIGRASCRERV